jgi:DNA modification methylase
VTPYYDDGKGIVIYNGDCRDVLPTLGRFDLLLTDPPYGI